MSIPHPKQWRHVLRRRIAEKSNTHWRWLLLRILDDAIARAKRFDISTDSRALSFTFILSLVPLLAIAFTFFKLFGGLQNFLDNNLKPLLSKNFPQSVAQQLTTFVDGLVGNLQTGTLGVVSFVTLSATVLALMMNIEQSFNQIFEARDRRSILKRVGSYWIMLSATPLIIVLSSAKSSELASALYTSTGFLNKTGIIDFLRFVVGHLVQMIGFGSLFVVLPERKPKLIAVFWGALLTNAIFQLLATINVHYATFVFSNRANLHLYGSLPLLVLVFLIWVRLVWLGILFGACLCASVDSYYEAKNSDSRLSSKNTPHNLLLNSVRLVDFYIKTFQEQKKPSSQTDVASHLQLSLEELEMHQDSLKRKGYIIPIQFEGLECFTATAAALQCYRAPQQLIADLLGIPTSTLTGIHNEGWKSESTDDLLKTCESLLLRLNPKNQLVSLD